MEKLYVVEGWNPEGWNGDREFYHSEERALKEFKRRIVYANGREEVVCKEKSYIKYKWHCEIDERDYFLTFTEEEFYD